MLISCKTLRYLSPRLFVFSSVELVRKSQYHYLIMFVERDYRVLFQIFGPVMSCIRFESMEDLIEIANNTMYGLAAGVVTKDLDKALYVANNMRAGSVW